MFLFPPTVVGRGENRRHPDTQSHMWYLGTEELVNFKTKISSYCLLFSFFSVSNSSWEWSPGFCLHWLTPLYTALSGATQCDGGITTSSGPWWILLHLLWHATPLASPSTVNSSSSRLLWCNTHPGIPPTPPTPFAYPCPSPGSWGPKSSGFCFGHRPLSTLPQRSELFCGSLSSCTWQFPTTSLVKIKAIFPITAPCFHLSPQHFISNMEPSTFPTKTSWLCPDFWLWLPRGGGKRGDGSDGNRQDQEHTLCIKGQPLSGQLSPRSNEGLMSPDLFFKTRQISRVLKMGDEEREGSQNAFTRGTEKNTIAVTEMRLRGRKRFGRETLCIQFWPAELPVLKLLRGMSELWGWSSGREVQMTEKTLATLLSGHPTSALSST